MKLDYYAWCCNLESDSGEGILAEKYLKNLSLARKLNIKAFSPEINIHYKSGKKIFIKKKKNNLFFFKNKYLLPFYGIFFLWKNFFQKKKLIYVNYLPLWNTLTILFLPPNTIMGPITGSVNINDKKNLSGLVRTYIFPILYRVNLRLMLIRNKKILFSTSILKKYISRENLNKCYFNFLNYLFKYEKFNKNKKNIDFLIYYRKHSNKYSNFHINFINKIVHKNKVVLFGDKLNIKGVINLNKISRKKVLSLLKRTKNSISGDDNLYSLYNIDCLKNGVIIFFNKRMKVFLDVYNKKNYLPINFDDNNLNLFKKKINQRKLFTKTKNKFFSDLDKKINKYFLTIS